MTDSRDTGRCPFCDAVLETFGEEPGDRPYWACSSCDAPPILPPRNVGYATALIRTRIVEDGLDQFDDMGVDPACFLDRVWDRLALVTDGIREHDATRERPTDHQPVLGEWSA